MKLAPLLGILLVSLALAACGNEARDDSAAGDVGASDTDGDAGTHDVEDADTDTGGADTDDADTTPDGVDALPEPEQHRPEATACDDTRPTDGPFLDPGAEQWSSCTSHDDCTDGVNGRCTGNSHDGWNCTYDQCFDDDGCGSGVCACSGGWRSDANVCLSSNCRVDADCGDGGWCSPTLGDCGEYGGVVGYYCRTPDDECLDDSDCGEDDWGPGYCMYSEAAGHWTCSYSQCAG